MNAWGSQCQPDVRKLFHTVLPFGCILSGPFPAEARHRETRLGVRGEGGGEFKLTHYLSEKRRTGTTAIMPVACGGVAVVLRLQTPELVPLRASVGSTEASASLPARIGVVG